VSPPGVSGHAAGARAAWSEGGAAQHFVQFYEQDAFLLESLGEFVGTGLSAGDACIVLTSDAKRAGLEAKLRAAGLDVAAAAARGQYVSLDAAETLARFMVDGTPEAARFAAVAGPIIKRAAEGQRRVRVFGDMVAHLCAEGRHAAALQLEELWNDLGRTHPFTLFCAYPLSNFGGAQHAAALGDICTAHASVIPTESYTTLADVNERHRAVARWQQKAHALEAEVAERKRAEESLRAVKDELEVQVADLRRLHEMSGRLTGTLDMEVLLAEVLRAAMSVQGTDLGLLSLCDAEQAGLDLKVQSGFDEEFLKTVEHVPVGGGACGTCYERRQRVVVEDVDADPVFADYRWAAARAGFRACHSTPLITRAGHIIGVLSVHFRQTRRPAEREMQLMDLYARMAADIIENARLHQQAQRELEARERLLIREQAARAEAESANRLKDEFLATVSHELRTPLTAIIGWTHMLRSGQLDEQAAAGALATIERNARSQTQIVEDLLDVSRIITGKLRLDVQPVNPAAAIEAAIEAVRPAAEAKGVRLMKVIDTGAGVVMGDQARLQQVVWNLLANAIKFTPRGGRVQVKLERMDAHVEIAVGDDGAGIAAEFLPFVFDRFRQADMSTTRLHGGLGLGLAIVRHLVEQHGGVVRAESRGEGHGATFVVTLPLASELRNADGGTLLTEGLTGEAAEQLAEQAASDQPQAASLSGVRVLVVDDEADTRELLKLMMSQCGASVATAGSAAEAMALLAQFKPDVLVSDIAMPGADGYELIRMVRALPQASGGRVPAVALTAYARAQDRQRAIKAGYQLHVPKPVVLSELVTMVASLVERAAAS
jgi:signal transduction histidine kinase/ActR/RegA family two-component response regulator